ncbi:hypothetical protein [Hyphococcus sp.]|uniref:hypothetical protein n=1 Tax=Hyphococcus sp. TaxID=2038636 RepID=UPI00375314F3
MGRLSGRPFSLAKHGGAQTGFAASLAPFDRLYCIAFTAENSFRAPRVQPNPQRIKILQREKYAKRKFGG